MNELELTYKSLLEEYGFSVDRKKLAEITNKSVQWVDMRLRDGVGLPKYKKEGRAVIFPTIEVAKWLTTGNIETV